MVREVFSWEIQLANEIFPLVGRPRGRPRETWQRTVEKECAKLGLTLWAAAAAVAKNRDRWRASPALSPTRGQGTKQ